MLSNIPPYVIRFFFKVSLLTLVFAIIWGIVYYKPHVPYNDHSPSSILNATDPGRASQRTTDTDTNIQDIDTFIDTTVDQLIKDKEHGSAVSFSSAQSKYNKICSAYEKVCNKTFRKGTYSANEKLMYQVIIIHLFNRAGNYLDTDLNNKITSITINSSALGRRGSAGHKYIKMNVELIPNAQEFWEVLSHELGHIVDFAHLKGYSSTKSPIYTEFGQTQRAIDDPSLDYYKISRVNENTRRGGANYKDFVSGYGMRGMYEDFAEAHNLRFNHNDYFRTLANGNTVIKKKYQYLFDLYDGQHYQNLTGKTPPVYERAWDTTKLGE